MASGLEITPFHRAGSGRPLVRLIARTILEVTTGADRVEASR